MAEMSKNGVSLAAGETGNRDAEENQTLRRFGVMS